MHGLLRPPLAPTHWDNAQCSRMDASEVDAVFQDQLIET